MTKMGRPEVGPAINIRVPQSVLDAIDWEAQRLGTTRAALIREALDSKFGRMAAELANGRHPYSGERING